MTDLRLLQKEMEDAQDKLHRALVASYPEGKQVLGYFTSNQEKPTRGIVIGHGIGRFAGRVNVRWDTLKKVVRDFNWSELR